MPTAREGSNEHARAEARGSDSKRVGVGEDVAPRVVIVGGGFGGLFAARALRKAPVRITLIDKQNHHLFQPLLYQVATAALSPADIAAPIRQVLSKQKQTEVVLAEVTEIDVVAQRVRFRDVAGMTDRTEEIGYDWLIVAAGVRHAYFGHDEWEELAPGLKDIGDALRIRDRFLISFEAAERASDPQERRALLTFVVVGAGPTGVELAGAMAEIARRAIPRDFRRIDTSTARVILVEGEGRVLPAFSEDLSQRAKKDLEALGVEVWLNTRVTGVHEKWVEIGDERIVTRNVFWAAGVQASRLGAQLGAEMDNKGRVKVKPDLSLPGHEEVFVVGDLAAVRDSETGEEVPGVAPAAMQMGNYVARVIRQEVEGRKSAGSERRAFRYRDKGMLATIGRAKAVGTVGKMKFTGLIAWLMWMSVHIFFLIGYRNRLIVMIQWAWAYFRFERGARLITRLGIEPRKVDVAEREPVESGAA